MKGRVPGTYTVKVVPQELEDILVRTSDTVGGAMRFKGTRVHAKLLFDYVLTGESVEEFLENYPEVTREQAEALLEWERRRVGEALELAS